MKEFADLIKDIDDGQVNETLSSSIAEVVTATKNTNLAGAITLTLKFKPEGRTVLVAADIKTKVPRPKTNTSAYFATDHGELRRDDPLQQKLPLRDVSAPPTPLRRPGDKALEERGPYATKAESEDPREE